MFTAATILTLEI